MQTKDQMMSRRLMQMKYLWFGYVRLYKTINVS